MSDLEGTLKALLRRVAQISNGEEGVIQHSVQQTEGFALSSSRGLVYNDELNLKQPWRKAALEGEDQS